MKCVVLVPGIQGSVLETPGGDQVWPPKPSEVVLGYGRLSELMREDLVSTVTSLPPPAVSNGLRSG